jgi:hypothetical protein
LSQARLDKPAGFFNSAYAAIVPLVFVGALIVYKSSSSIAAVRRTWTEGSLSTRPDVVELGTGTFLVALERSLNYGIVILPALIFGILIGAAVRAFVHPDLLARALGGRGIGSQLRAAAAGAPLMLCSCCIAPVFNTAYERGLRLASSITLMLASPSLNPAALLLTFVLLPAETALARLVMAILAVLGAGVLIEALFPRVRAISVDCVKVETEVPAGIRDGARRFVGSVGHVFVRTVPALAIGVVGSMILVQYMPQELLSSDTVRVLAIIVVATVAVPLALPTFFEIPLALGLIAAGAPTGAALALLFAGPAVNLPSLLTLAKTTSWKVSASLALAIWAIAVAGGLVAG